jgi:hypothetical protein
MTMLILSTTSTLKPELLSTLIKVMQEDGGREAIILLFNQKAINPKTLKLKAEEGAAKFQETINILSTICLIIST